MLILRALLAAFLLALAFPTLSLWPLAFVAFPILFIPLLNSSTSPKQSAWYLFAFSFACNVVGFYWIAYTIHEFAEFPWILSVPITLLLFIFLGLSSALLGYFWQWLHNKYLYKNFFVSLFSILIFFCVWDVFDLRMFPWAPMMAVGGNDILLSSVGVLGSWGWRILFFSLCCLIFVVGWTRQSIKIRLISASIAMLLLSGAFAAGVYHTKELKELYSEEQPVVILQGNIGNYEKRQSENGVEPTVRNVLGIYRNLIEEAATVYAEVSTGTQALEPWFVWPETSFPGFPLRDLAMQDQLDFWLQLSRGVHLVGAYEDGQMEFDGKNKAVEYNIAMLLHESTGYVDHYRKMLLMPFGEYFPGDRLIPKVYDWIPQVNHFGKGEKPKLLAHPDPQGPVFLPVICYEVLFEGLMDDFLEKAKRLYPGRPVIIYNPTNDSWFGKSVEPFMHARLALWQSARVSLPMLRATNTGISMVVAPWGEILSQGPLFGEALVYADLPVKKAQPRRELNTKNN